MTYEAIVSEILNLRFDENWRSSAKSWVALRFARLWAAKRWNFRFSTDVVTVTAGSASLGGVISTLGIVRALYNSDGGRLRYLPFDDFQSLYANQTEQGTPAHYTVQNRTVTVGPIPDTTATDWLLTMERKLPPLADNTEISLLPTEWHYALVDGGLAHGLWAVQDPSWQDAEAVWQGDIEAMAMDYVEDERGQPIVWPTNRG